MNNLAYMSQDANNVAPKIEEIIRKDLELNSPLPFTIEQEGQAGATAANILNDIGKGIFGGKTTPLFSLTFDLQKPKPAQLVVNAARQGVGCFVSQLIFSTNIKKSVNGPVMLEGPKMFGTSKFTGDVDTASKLNSKSDLLKLAAKFSKTKSDIGNVTMDRYFSIEPTDQGARVVVITLPRTKSLGFGATTDAQDFFTLADMIENAL